MCCSATFWCDGRSVSDSRQPGSAEGGFENLYRDWFHKPRYSHFDRPYARNQGSYLRRWPLNAAQLSNGSHCLNGGSVMEFRRLLPGRRYGVVGFVSPLLGTRNWQRFQQPNQNEASCSSDRTELGGGQMAKKLRKLQYLCSRRLHKIRADNDSVSSLSE